ncbi:MAG TPA: ectonucleotide pyrophosphatase/phosphodiesterase [Bryobacteraceae bacterium]|nr:ectonucleotide pyrophosphatase/phosphodiesterase [Bryobacteraceae bacterium]
MTTRFPLFFASLAALCIPAVYAADGGHPVLLVSIDGMRPDYVLKADQYGLKIPRLRTILASGAHATGVRGVLPTVTYPSHTTLLTGVWPSKHGIYSNVAFDPQNLNAQGWLWYSEDIRVPTLWEAAAKAGYGVGSVSWPVSVGAKGVSYLIPEYWRAPKSSEDIKLIRALSTPGLVAEIEKTAGAYIDDLDQAEAGDRQRTQYAVAIIRMKKPRLMTVHLAALDHLEHADGPFSPSALRTLEQADAELGELEDAMSAVSASPILCVVSDHGFARTDHSFNLVGALTESGLPASAHLDGGSASIVMNDPRDEAGRRKVSEFLQRLADEPANGIERILNSEEISRMGGWTRASFWVDMKTNYSVVGTGPVNTARKAAGTHGFAPTHSDLLAAFFICGPRRGALAKPRRNRYAQYCADAGQDAGDQTAVRRSAGAQTRLTTRLTRIICLAKPSARRSCPGEAGGSCLRPL